MGPESQFKGEARYKTDFGLTATATARFVGKKAIYMTESTTYPATKTVRYTMSPYWAIDTRLEQRVGKNWLISLDCKNLFDRDYDTRLETFYDSAGKGYISGYPGAGRSFFLNVSWEY
jgi:iron complex outermembrane receptor protein